MAVLGKFSKNEPEFRAYYCLFHMHDPEVRRKSQKYRPQVFRSRLMRFARRICEYGSYTTEHAGKRRGTHSEYTFACPSRFFSLATHPNTPYLVSCLCEVHFDGIRRAALRALNKSYRAVHRGFPIDGLVDLLGFDNATHAVAFAEHFDLSMYHEPDGSQTVRFGQKAADGGPKEVDADTQFPKTQYSRRVEAVRHQQSSLQQYIFGTAPTLSESPVSRTPSRRTMSFELPDKWKSEARQGPAPTMADRYGRKGSFLKPTPGMFKLDLPPAAALKGSAKTHPARTNSIPEMDMSNASPTADRPRARARARVLASPQKAISTTSSFTNEEALQDKTRYMFDDVMEELFDDTLHDAVEGMILKEVNDMCLVHGIAGLVISDEVDSILMEETLLAKVQRRSRQAVKKRFFRAWVKAYRHRSSLPVKALRPHSNASAIFGGRPETDSWTEDSLDRLEDLDNPSSTLRLAHRDMSFSRETLDAETQKESAVDVRTCVDAHWAESDAILRNVCNRAEVALFSCKLPPTKLIRLRSLSHS